MVRRVTRLRDAKTNDEVCQLPRDNKTYGDYWILADGYQVAVVHQKAGEAPQASVDVPRRIFNELIDFYCANQFAKKKRKP